MTLPWKTESDRSISVMEYEIYRLLHHCYIGMLQGRWAFRLDIDKEYHCGNVFFRQIDLVYDRR